MELPERLGRYRILGELGRGGMGIVLLGEDPELQREVAIKTLPRELARDPEAYERFRREARLLASLNHPNVATIHSLELIGDTPILTMERIRGGTLASRLRSGPLAPEELLHVGTRIASAVEAAHEQGVIHRDLKPGNVMLGEDGMVKVLDFGLAMGREALNARAVSRGPVTPRGGFVPAAEDAGGVPGAASPAEAPTTAGSGPSTSSSGTAGYMSPEQIRGGDVAETSDLFSLGVILYECAVGVSPFAAGSLVARLEATLERMPSMEPVRRVFPERVCETIERCLMKVPAERPASAREVRRVLEDALERRRFDQFAEAVQPPPCEGTTDRARPVPNNLPQALTSFIGREAELAAIGELLATRPLVTLTGAGGAGKTRLALEAARTALAGGATARPGARDATPWEGVYLVELAPLTNPALLDRTIMTAVGIAEQHDRPARETILEHIGSTRILLVLDNCEHLVEEAASFAHEALERCSSITILATGRAPLGLRAETRHVVPPLSVGDLEVDRRPEELEHAGAVRLFIERARQVRPGLELTPATLAAIVGICRRLDGLPLALELAASRVRVLDPAALLSRLDDRFRLLTGGSREALPHQRTLLASIEWSHDQLAPAEQVLFRRLGIFVGGFTFESVEAVCLDSGLEQWEVLDALGSLIDKSLIEPAPQRDASPDDAPRYRMLESFREFASAAAGRAGEMPALRERFVLYWRDVARHAADHLNGPDVGKILARLDAELPNLREALRIALDGGMDARVGLRLAGSLMRYWMRRSLWSEGLGFLARALAQPGAEQPSAERAVALNAIGVLEYLTGRYAESIAHQTEAVDLFAAQGMPAESARARTNLGNAYAFSGRHAEALREHEAALEVARRIDHNWLIGAALINICNAAEALGDLERVGTAAREGSERFERAGDLANLVMARNYLGAYAFRIESFADALAIFRQNRELALQLGDRYNAAHQRYHGGLCLMGLERYAEAWDAFQESFGVAVEFDEPNLLTSVLEGFAQCAERAGEHDAAARFFAAAERLREERHAPLRDSNVASFGLIRASIREALGGARYEERVAEGRAMTPAALTGEAQRIGASLTSSEA